jgi:hypothetical protein
MSDWEIVETYGSEEEANLAVGYLGGQGIDARIESLRFHQEPMNFGALSDVRVLVQPADLERATKLLEERETGAEVLAEGDLPPEESEA